MVPCRPAEALGCTIAVGSGPRWESNPAPNPDDVLRFTPSNAAGGGPMLATEPRLTSDWESFPSSATS